MRLRSPLLVLALGVVLALVTGCASGGSATRTPGEPITRTDADVLAGVLHRDYQKGGADFVLTAPYAEGALLTLTGEVDFRHSVGRAQAVTTYRNGQPTEKRTVFFTTKELWEGDLPGLSAELVKAGLPDVSYVRRPLATGSEGGAPALIDVAVALVPRLSARSTDDPRSYLDRGYTWQGQRSINGRLASLYRSGTGNTIAVSTSGKLLAQYATQLPGQDFSVTITLSDHGPRTINPPTEAETVDATRHPDVAAAVGV